MKEKEIPPITKRIFEICEQKSITQTELANRIGKQQSTVSNWKQNFRAPDAKLIQSIAYALDVSVNWLVTGEEPSSSCPELPVDQSRLLSYYNAANQEGQERIMEQAEFYSKKYPKDVLDLQNTGSA